MANKQTKKTVKKTVKKAGPKIKEVKSVFVKGVGYVPLKTYRAIMRSQ